jgi:hypothetical protein
MEPRKNPQLDIKNLENEIQLINIETKNDITYVPYS